MIYEVIKSNFIIKEKRSLISDRHFHEHIEVIYMLKGCVEAVVEDTDYTVEQGDFCVVFPFQPHSFARSVAIRCYSLMCSQQEIEFLQKNTSFMASSKDNEAKINQGYQSIFEQSKPKNPVIKQHSGQVQYMKLLMEMMVEDFGDIKYEEMDSSLTKSSLNLFFYRLLCSVELNDITATSSDTIKDIINYCKENYSNPISLQHISNALYLSPKYISNIFSGRLHVSFLDYISTLRVHDACRLLQNTNAGISKIAFEVGFESIRTFNRRFAEIIGVSPLEYRKLKIFSSKFKRE